MNQSDVLIESTLSALNLIARGKVRDIYQINRQLLLIVTTDRLSAFDVVMPDAVPGKGRVLTRVSNFWFERSADLIANHLTDYALEDFMDDPNEIAQIKDRAIIVKCLKPLPVEAIVRGYLIGSGWEDYSNSGMVCGITLPEGLRQAQKLPEAIYTPSSKAEVGLHDENISFDESVKRLGAEVAAQVRDISLKIYQDAADFALQRGIIIADTKFEFGLDYEGKLHLIDEVLTPDSSRFWPLDEYRVGVSPPSFDKQFIRDYLQTLDWDKTPPGPKIPQAVLRKSAEKYAEAEAMLLNG